MANEYLHGVYTSETETEIVEVSEIDIAQVVIGTAPIHMLADPAAAVNKPIICRNMPEFREKVGFSYDFKKYTVCQSAYASFSVFGVAPLVFINVLDLAKHKAAVEEKEYPVNDNSISIADDVIVSSLVITHEEEPIGAEKYITQWVDGTLVVAFNDEIEGTVKVKYDKAAPEKVTSADIVGSWNTDTDEFTGVEAIRLINPALNALPTIITAPGWSKNDVVGAILDAKCKQINGCYSAFAFSDIDTAKATTRKKAIEEKKARTFTANSAACYPMISKNGYTIAYSAYLAALIMYLAAKKDGVTCDSPSNKSIDIDKMVLEDGTELFYDSIAGNELNAAGIVTIISRGGKWYAWGNNTAAYPATKDPKDRWIMTRLSFNWVENDFINTYIAGVDDSLSPKKVEDSVTDANIKLASLASDGKIIAAKIVFNAADNPVDKMLQGQFKFRTRLAGNIPAEYFENEFSYDKEAFENAMFGGVTNE